MRLTIFTLAHHIHFSEPGNLLNISGIYSGMSAPAFPFVVPRMLLVARFTGNPAEYEREFEVVVSFTDEDGLPGPIPSDRQLLRMKTGQSGEDSHCNYLLEIFNTRFVKPGWYQFAIQADGEMMEELPVNIAQSVKRSGWGV
jgi:hypothetical protein